uniref:Uncharacterized protein n=1 Tax=Arundo donax TaxID=35708 RepID=A0A0A9B3P0_ARUDO
MIYKETKRLAAWRGGCFSRGGRLVLRESCLSTIPIYLMSLYQFKNNHTENGFTKEEILVARYFWSNGILFASRKKGIES